MRTLISTTILLFSFSCFAQNEAFEFNQKLNKGINMGNMFEAPDENSWGNQWQEDYFPIIKELGFSHVRIPIRWEPENRSMGTKPYTIYPSFLNRIKHVVDRALENKLIAIINMHHHEVLYENPDEQTERFLKQWEQISNFFQDYSDSLVFEILNEPHGNLNANIWNKLSQLALNKIRQKNPTRFVLIGTAEYGGIGGLSKLEIPKDDHLILTVHYYNPFKFTHQGASWSGEQSNNWFGTKWLNTEAERQSVRNDFQSVVNFSNSHNIPVHIGEFGAYEKADIESRIRWSNFLARYFDECNFSWAYWEFSAGFGIYNKKTKTIKQDLANALLNNPMTDTTILYSKPIFKSEFSGINNNWKLYTQQGASAIKTVNNGKLQIEITNGSDKSWHVQVVKHNVNLEKGKMYQLTFKANANRERNFTAYIGQSSDPWTSHSGSSGFQTTTIPNEYSLFFQMLNDSDSKARIVFDLGNNIGEFSLDDIQFNEMSLTSNTSINTKQTKPKSNQLIVYPNPTDDYLYYSYNGNINEITIANTKGQTVSRYTKTRYSENFINVSKLKKGIYLFIPNRSIVETVKFCIPN